LRQNFVSERQKSEDIPWIYDQQAKQTAKENRKFLEIHEFFVGFFDETSIDSVEPRQNQSYLRMSWQNLPEF
jgi:hypothetical protein